MQIDANILNIGSTWARDYCLALAKASPCLKRGFGAVLEFHYPTGGGEPAYYFGGNNGSFSDAKNLCSSQSCIRESIPSGTHSLIGGCHHAEEGVIWECIRKFGSAKGARLWVSGVDKTQGRDIPLVKDSPRFYCLRCATLMVWAEVKEIHVWVGRDSDNQPPKWFSLSPQDAYDSALKVALGKVKIERIKSIVTGG